MAGKIKRESIDEVRQSALIDQVVGEHVTLRPAGVGSLKGLCPFHDERTPSFHVRPALGFWHCFGCDQGGDVFRFIQDINHMSFVESVEFLAEKYGVTLAYEEGGKLRRSEDVGNRRRLLEAHRIAEDFFRKFLYSARGKSARDFLISRGFEQELVDQFGVGAAPDSWDALTHHLRSSGFTDQEIVTSGLAIMGRKGPYDRFRDRVVWPIRDLTGQTIGFGARRLNEDPKSPKYLNTPETPIYNKSSVLYGIDLAKKDISQKRKVVVVEGYTDVMAAHAAGETTAVATCGTAFGAGHTQIIRRLLGDVADPAAGVVLADGRAQGGQVIFTFDGDEAGLAAARRAYSEDQAFAAQTFVAADPQGMDPCDIRLARGDQALRELVDGRVPLFEFVLRSVLESLDLDSAEGRVQGLRSVGPILAGIKDQALRNEYTRMVAGWIGSTPREVEAEWRAASRLRRSQVQAAGKPPEKQVDPPVGLDPQRVDLEKMVLASVLQRPLDGLASNFTVLSAESFRHEPYADVFTYLQKQDFFSDFVGYLQQAEAKHGVGALANDAAAGRWLESLVEGCEDSSVSAQLTALSSLPLPVGGEESQSAYAQGVVRALHRTGLEETVSNLEGRLRRLPSSSSQAQETFAELMAAQGELRAARASEQI